MTQASGMQVFRGGLAVRTCTVLPGIAGALFVLAGLGEIRPSRLCVKRAVGKPRVTPPGGGTRIRRPIFGSAPAALGARIGLY